MDAIMAAMAVLMYWMFRTKRAEIIALDFVLTILAINVAMMFSFWEYCAAYFFMLYAVKELVVGYSVGGHVVRQAYCVSCVFNVICGLEMNLSESLVLYNHYETVMMFVCFAKLLSAVDWYMAYGRRSDYVV